MGTRPRKSPLLQMDIKMEDLMLGYVFLMFSLLCMLVCLKSFFCLTISSICDLTYISSSHCSSSLERAYHSMYLSVCWFSSDFSNPVKNLCLLTLLIDMREPSLIFTFLQELVAATMSTAGVSKMQLCNKIAQTNIVLQMFDKF